MEQTNVKFEDFRSETPDLETAQSLPSNISGKLPRVRKSTAGKRKIQHEWKDEETNGLIAAVELRPVLWNGRSGEYKCSRQDGWREVLNELNIEGIDVNEVKTKWLALRATFKTNLAKLREKNMGQGVHETQKVNWRHFNKLLFLEVNKVHKSIESVPSIELTSVPVVDNPSIIDDYPDSPQPLTPNIELGQRCMQATPTSPSGSSTPHVSPMLNSAVAALQPSVSNSTFCDHLLAELNTLSEVKSRNLRRLLMQVMYNFMDTSEELTQLCNQHKNCM